MTRLNASNRLSNLDPNAIARGVAELLSGQSHCNSSAHEQQQETNFQNIIC